METSDADDKDYSIAGSDEMNATPECMATTMNTDDTSHDDLTTEPDTVSAISDPSLVTMGTNADLSTMITSDDQPGGSAAALDAVSDLSELSGLKRNTSDANEKGDSSISESVEMTPASELTADNKHGELIADLDTVSTGPSGVKLDTRASDQQDPSASRHITMPDESMETLMKTIDDRSDGLFDNTDETSNPLELPMITFEADTKDKSSIMSTVSESPEVTMDLSIDQRDKKNSDFTEASSWVETSVTIDIAVPDQQDAFTSDSITMSTVVEDTKTVEISQNNGSKGDLGANSTPRLEITMEIAADLCDESTSDSIAMSNVSQLSGIIMDIRDDQYGGPATVADEHDAFASDFTNMSDVLKCIETLIKSEDDHQDESENVPEAILTSMEPSGISMDITTDPCDGSTTDPLAMSSFSESSGITMDTRCDQYDGPTTVDDQHDASPSDSINMSADSECIDTFLKTEDDEPVSASGSILALLEPSGTTMEITAETYDDSMKDSIAMSTVSECSGMAMDTASFSTVGIPIPVDDSLPVLPSNLENSGLDSEFKVTTIDSSNDQHWFSEISESSIDSACDRQIDSTTIELLTGSIVTNTNSAGVNPAYSFVDMLNFSNLSGTTSGPVDSKKDLSFAGLIRLPTESDLSRITENDENDPHISTSSFERIPSSSSLFRTPLDTADSNENLPVSDLAGMHTGFASPQPTKLFAKSLPSSPSTVATTSTFLNTARTTPDTEDTQHDVPLSSLIGGPGNPKPPTGTTPDDAVDVPCESAGSNTQTSDADESRRLSSEAGASASGERTRHKSEDRNCDGLKAWTRSMIRCLTLTSCVRGADDERKKISSSTSEGSSDESTSSRRTFIEHPSPEEESSSDDSSLKNPSTINNDDYRKKDLTETIQDLALSTISPLARLNCDMAFANILLVSREYYTRCFENHHMDTLTRETMREFRTRMEWKLDYHDDFLDLSAYCRLRNNLEVMKRILRSFQLLHAQVVQEMESLIGDKHHLQSMLDNIANPHMRLDGVDEIIEEMALCLGSMNHRMDLLCTWMKVTSQMYTLFCKSKEKATVGLSKM